MEKIYISRLLSRSKIKLSEEYECYFDIIIFKINKVVTKLLYKFPFETSKTIRKFMRNNFIAKCIYCNTDLQLQDLGISRFADEFTCPNKKDHLYNVTISDLYKKNNISINQTLFLREMKVYIFSTRSINDFVISENGKINNQKAFNKAILPIKYDLQLINKINKLLLLI